MDEAAVVSEEAPEDDFSNVATAFDMCFGFDELELVETDLFVWVIRLRKKNENQLVAATHTILEEG